MPIIIIIVITQSLNHKNLIMRVVKGTLPINNVVLTPAQSSGGTMTVQVSLASLRSWGPLQRCGPRCSCQPSVLLWTFSGLLGHCPLALQVLQFQLAATILHYCLLVNSSSPEGFTGPTQQPEPMMVPPLTPQLG